MGHQRPAAVIDCEYVLVELRIPALGQDRPRITNLLEFFDDRRFQGNDFVAVVERLIQPAIRSAHSFIEYCVDRVFRNCRQSLGGKRSSALLNFSAPAFDLLERKSVQRKYCRDRVVSSIIDSGHARRYSQWNLTLGNVVERANVEILRNQERDPIPGRKTTEHA